MNSKKKECLETKAEKFQRLILGSLLFISYIFHYMPIVIFVAIIMFVSCLFSAKHTPFYQLYIRAINPISNASITTGSACTFDSRGNRFACGIGWVFLTASMLFFYPGKDGIAWILVLIVGFLSVLAGTTGFCLGTAIYALLFKP
jgi:hypothetical protein